MTYPYDTKIHHMNLTNAEISKLCNNNYISMKISYANTIAQYCDKIPNADAAAVLNCVGDDPRIGNKYLKPGLGYGGYCFPRDQKAFIHSSNKHGIVPSLALATEEVNHFHRTWIKDIILSIFNRGQNG